MVVFLTYIAYVHIEYVVLGLRLGGVVVRNVCCTSGIILCLA